ncbi:MAG: hypothetical protein AXA67_01230 [Methylothermaceae bacteria B42]|nr:MAG: hypothetical protein AXA67_01230 [Methylothermaceae bacteria B42]
MTPKHYGLNKKFALFKKGQTPYCNPDARIYLPLKSYSYKNDPNIIHDPSRQIAHNWVICLKSSRKLLAAYFSFR